jgi:hypothetical protein
MRLLQCIAQGAPALIPGKFSKMDGLDGARAGKRQELG